MRTSITLLIVLAITTGCNKSTKPDPAQLKARHAAVFGIPADTPHAEILSSFQQEICGLPNAPFPVGSEPASVSLSKKITPLLPRRQRG